MGFQIVDNKVINISENYKSQLGFKVLKSLLGMLPAGPIALDTRSKDRDLQVS